MIRKLKPEIKQLWLAALRSGDYKQAVGGLRNHHNAMCCLGVLCNLHAQAHPDIAATQLLKTAYLGESSIPAPAVLKWAFEKWTSHDSRSVTFRHYNFGQGLSYGGHLTLAGMNDSRDFSFKQIANVISKFL